MCRRSECSQCLGLAWSAPYLFRAGSACNFGTRHWNNLQTELLELQAKSSNRTKMDMRQLHCLFQPSSTKDLLFTFLTNRKNPSGVIGVNYHALTTLCSTRENRSLSARPRSERSGFEPWPGTLSCILGEDTWLSQCLSPPSCINGCRRIVEETKQIAGEWPAMD